MNVPAVPSDPSRELVATRLFDAPRELVFRMWTDPEHIRHWWGPHGFTTTIHEMDVRPGGTWRFVMHGPDGTDYQNRIVYNEIVVPERIAYSHVSGPLFDSVVTFTERGKQTEVTVRMILESAEMKEKIIRDFGAEDGLHQTLERLGERVANPPFIISRTFDGPRDLFFELWTRSEHLAHWWGPKGSKVSSFTNDLRPGGVMHYALRMPDGMELWGRWVYREIVPPERLAFINSFADREGNLQQNPWDESWPAEMLTVVTFDERDGRTKVTVESQAIDASDVQRRTFAENHGSMEQGWGGSFEQLADYVAARSGKA